MERIRGIRKHVGVLERRATYLKQRIDDGRLSEKAAVFEDRERKAIEAAANALQVVERLQDVATSPVLALEELLDALEHMADPAQGPSLEWTDRVRDATSRGRTVLALIESVGG
jgi:hypothetical protein